MEPVRWRGFQSKYFLSTFFRRFSVERDLVEKQLLKKDKSPPNEKLDNLVEKSRAPLLKIQTAIPLNPFPDKVIIDVNKVTIIYKYFFWSGQIHSVFIKDISDVLVETGWLWSTLRIIDVGFTENSIDVGYLKTDQAVRARKIIQGLIVAQKNGVDLSKCDTTNLVEKLEQLGKAEKSI